MIAANMIKWKMRAIMSDRRLMIKDVAELTGFHPNTISKWKNTDEMPKISGPEAEKLCEALKCDFEDLIGKGEI